MYLSAWSVRASHSESARLSSTSRIFMDCGLPGGGSLGRADEFQGIGAPKVDGLALERLLRTGKYPQDIGGPVRGHMAIGDEDGFAAGERLDIGGLVARVELRRKLSRDLGSRVGLDIA